LKGGELPIAFRTPHRKRDDRAFALFCGDTKRLTKKGVHERFTAMVIEIASCDFNKIDGRQFEIRDVAETVSRCGIRELIEQELRGENDSVRLARQDIKQRPTRVFMRDLHSDLSRSTFP